jgi:hypothetical protein
MGGPGDGEGPWELPGMSVTVKSILGKLNAELHRAEQGESGDEGSVGAAQKVNELLSESKASLLQREQSLQVRPGWQSQR